MEGESGKKMNVFGIICEYDPFHAGHHRQFQLIRERCPGAAIVCLMSGCFTQRGMPALYTPAFRAQAALDAGADMVLELPAAYAVRDAEHFALGGVFILSALGFVDYLSFGTEDPLECLLPAAALLEAPDEAFTHALKDKLSTGASHAAAQGATLAERLASCPSAVQKPNNILALCYLRALKRLHSAMQPFAVQRRGDYHAETLNDSYCTAAQPGGDYPVVAQAEGEYPSATAVRAAILRGDLASAERVCGYSLPTNPICLPTALDSILLYKLRTASPQALAALPGCGEGLENRLFTAAAAAASRDELLAALKTKRYTYARLSRLCCHALLDITGDLLERYPLPPYVRLIGISRQTPGLLKALKNSDIPIVSKAAAGDRTHPLYQLDMRVYDLWALGAGLPKGILPGTPMVVRK